MNSYELECSRKGSSDKKISLNVGVDPHILKQIEDTIEEQQVIYKNEEVLLKDLYGDCVVDVDKITLGQIAWLLKHREIVYAFLENDNQQIAIGIREKR